VKAFSIIASEDNEILSGSCGEAYENYYFIYDWEES